MSSACLVEGLVIRRITMAATQIASSKNVGMAGSMQMEKTTSPGMWMMSNVTTARPPQAVPRAVAVGVASLCRGIAGWSAGKSATMALVAEASRRIRAMMVRSSTVEMGQ
jgi:hypothetical protein